MANWINCDYHGTQVQHERQGINNRPVNLDFVASYHYAEGNRIIFIVPTKENIQWHFINDAVMGGELQRIDEAIAKLTAVNAN